MAKRFYKTVGVEPAENGYHVTLDGRVLKTPGKKPLVCETKNQARCVADEWQAQTDEILPETMPCTRLMNVACEQTIGRRPELIEEFRKYCGTDLLCYRTDEPKDLAERQDEHWQPVLDWAASSHEIKLAITDGLGAIAQPDRSLDSAAQFAEKLTDVKLTILLHFTASYGSGVLALAVLDTHMNAENAFNLSKLDETFQNERWGEDEEAVAARDLLREELLSLSQLINARG